MRLGHNQKIDLIRKVPLFSRLSKPELRDLAMLADEIDLRDGKEMTRQGHPGREFFVLLEGTADVRKNGRKINSLGPGDFFGEIGMLDRGPATATVVTDGPVEAMVLSHTQFRDAIKANDNLALQVIAAMAKRLAPETL